MLKAFEPIHSPDSKLLILGTGPSIRSLQKQQYYGHERNAFWPILSSLYSHPIETYEQKWELLLSHDLALWDVLKQFERTLSSDSAFHACIPNDVQAWMDEHPNLEKVLFNGQKACQLYKKYIGYYPQAIQFITLPSTSPAYTLLFESKLERWAKALKG